MCSQCGFPLCACEEQDRIGRARPARPALATPLVPELARLLARSESSRDVLDCRLLLTSKFLSAGKPLAVRIRSKTGGPGECAPNRGSHGQTVRVDRSVFHILSQSQSNQHGQQSASKVSAVNGQAVQRQSFEPWSQL